MGLALMLLTSTTPIAGAYSIHSGLTEGCHEKITQSAFLAVLPQLNPDASILLPTSEIWRKFADGMIRANGIKERFPEFQNDSFQLTLISILVGVRSPDTEGHATTNLARLRQIHGDPDPAGQYAHALRGAHDDGPEGDVAAIEGLRKSIIGLIGQTLESLRRSPA